MVESLTKSLKDNPILAAVVAVTMLATGVSGGVVLFGVDRLEFASAEALAQLERRVETMRIEARQDRSNVSDTLTEIQSALARIEGRLENQR